MLGGLGDILSNEKLERLEAMAEQTERAADKMQQAADTAMEAAVLMDKAIKHLVESSSDPR